MATAEYKGNISDYYWHAELYSPPCLEQREFAVTKNGEMVRHLSFSSIPKLRAYLIERAPHGVFFSSAKYKYPDVFDMNTKKKGWLGSDLIFDIDYDHLKKPSLAEAEKQALKLISILNHDFGFQDLMLVFSGSRGNHIHVRDDCIQMLNNAERREIVDYFQQYYPNTEKKDEQGHKIPDTGKRNPNFVEIDAPVTADITRLIRLPGTPNVKEESVGICRVIDINSVKIPVAPKLRTELRRQERRKKRGVVA